MAKILPYREYDKARLVKSLQAQRFMFELTYESLTSAEMEIRGVQGEYSVKDIIAHVAAWEVRGTTWIQAVLRGEHPEMPAPGHTWADLDALNAADFAANRDKPLGVVLNDFAAAFPPLMAAVQGLSQALILMPLAYRGTEGAETILVGRLVAWRYQHYREHAEYIRTWIREAREEHG